MSIVVLESPCKPSPSAVEAMRAIVCTCGGLNEYQDVVDKLWNMEEWDVADSSIDACWSAIRLRNTYYARAAILDCLLRGEAPYASHLLYTQVLDDDDEERRRGMEAGIELSHLLLLDEDAQHVFYDELGISGGMKAAAAKLYPGDAPPRYDLRQLGEKARAWYLERVPASIAWLK